MNLNGIAATDIPYTNKPRYESCISLGWYCGVATAMSHYGLRSHSGPFDWYVSDFKSILKLMETDFSDFMMKDNLYLKENNSTIFYDRKYGFRCGHDIKTDFESEYDLIHQKYMRRVQNFRYDIKHPTCFIRAVRNEDEILFIEKEREYIYEIIKRENPNNEIVFLTLKGQGKLSNRFLSFQLDLDRYSNKTYDMRTLFNSPTELSEYCKQSVLSKERIRCNKKFDQEHMRPDSKAAVLMVLLPSIPYEHRIASVFNDYYSNMEQGLFLWGAGTYGTEILKYFVNAGIKVNGIIDNNPDKIGTFYENIPIVSFDEITLHNQNIFISVAAKNMTDEIEKQIYDKYTNIKVLKLVDLFDLLNLQY